MTFAAKPTCTRYCESAHGHGDECSRRGEARRAAWVAFAAAAMAFGNFTGAGASADARLAELDARVKDGRL